MKIIFTLIFCWMLHAAVLYKTINLYVGTTGHAAHTWSAVLFESSCQLMAMHSILCTITVTEGPIGGLPHCEPEV
jgi:hypothetical protein